MKIDFEKFPLFQGLSGQRQVLNVKHVLADELYTKGQGIAFHALALKIYNSEGETEYSDMEYALLLDFAEHCMTPSFIDSLKSLKKDDSSGKDSAAILTDSM